MFRKESILDDVVIAAPCPVEWTDMEGDDERVRYCSRCELNVFNISEMSKRQAEAFLESNHENKCLRFFRRENGTLITKDYPIGRRMLQGIHQNLKALIVAFLAIFNGTTALAQSSDDSTNVSKTQNPKEIAPKPVVFDERGFSIGRHPRRVKKSPTLPEGTEQIDQKSEIPNIKMLANSKALSSYEIAQQCEANKDYHGAFVHYQEAIDTINQSTVRFDRQFALRIVRSYAANLRATGHESKAREIEEEFYRSAESPSNPNRQQSPDLVPPY